MHECFEGAKRSYLVQCSRCALARVVDVCDDADYALVMECCGCGRASTLELGAGEHKHACPVCGTVTTVLVVQGEAA